MMANHALVVAARGRIRGHFQNAAQNQTGAYAFDWVALKCPPFSARWSAVFRQLCPNPGTLMASGVAVLQALQIVKTPLAMNW